MAIRLGRGLILATAISPTLLAPSASLMCFVDYSANVKTANNTDNVKQEKCLATMIYGEARGESKTGMVAVAYTALNRATKKSVCQVVLAPKQYSVFNNNPKLREVATSMHIEPERKNSIDQKSWQESIEIAKMVIKRKVPDPTKGATHYLAPTLMKIKNYRFPRWSREYKMVAKIGNHRFYKPVDKVTIVAIK